MIAKIKNPALRRAVLVLAYVPFAIIYAVVGAICGALTYLSEFPDDIKAAW